MNSKMLTALIIAVAMWRFIPHSLLVNQGQQLSGASAATSKVQPTAANLMAKMSAPRKVAVWTGGVSADGSVIVGSFAPLIGPTHIYRWTESEGGKDLGTLGKKGAQPNSVSADGTVIVGRFAGAEFVPHAFRWTESAGVKDLGPMAIAIGVSADGSPRNSARVPARWETVVPGLVVSPRVKA